MSAINNDDDKKPFLPKNKSDEDDEELRKYKIDKHLIKCATFRIAISKLDFGSRNRENVIAPLLEAIGINSYDHLERYEKDIFVEAFKIQIEKNSLNMTLYDFIQHLKSVKPKQLDIVNDIKSNLRVLKKELNKIVLEEDDKNTNDQDDKSKIWFLYNAQTINDQNISDFVQLKTKLINDGLTMSNLVIGNMHNFKSQRKSKVFVFYDETLGNKFDSDLAENADDIYQKVGLEMYKDYLTNEFTRKTNEPTRRRFFTIPINGCKTIEYYWLTGDNNEHVYPIFENGTINDQKYSDLIAKLR